MRARLAKAVSTMTDASKCFDAFNSSFFYFPPRRAQTRFQSNWKGVDFFFVFYNFFFVLKLLISYLG